MSGIPADHADLVPASGGYITTSVGRRVRVGALAPEDILLEDVIQSLSRTCRFYGHCREFYSVAEHMVLTAEIAKVVFPGERTVVRCAALHDAAEAYVGDLASPVKALVPQFKALEARVFTAVATALNLPPETDPAWEKVKRCDRLALFIEACCLLRPVPDWVQPLPDEVKHLRARSLPPARARAELAWLLSDLGYTVPDRLK